MNLLSAEDIQSGFESELIDLDAVSLTRLRTLDNSMLRQPLSHVLKQARCSTKIRAACSSAEHF